MKTSRRLFNIRRKFVFCAVAILLAVVLTCIATAIVLSQSSAYAASEALTGAQIYEAIVNAPVDYVSEEVIFVSGDTAMNGATENSTVQKYVVTSGQSVRFVAADSGAKLTFSVPLEIEAEARVIFDVETRFKAGGNLLVDGTLRINHRMYNAAQITIGNKADPYAEVASEGILVNGSLNNDALNGGAITVNESATLETVASTQSTYKTETGEDTFSNRDGGTLMLKNGADSLGLTVNGTLKNSGSVIYENDAEMPDVSGNAAVPATFIDVTVDDYDVAGIKNVTGTAVLYAADNDQTIWIGKTTDYVSIKNINLLSFGKITYKIHENYQETNWLFLLNKDVSLGGGVVDGVEFTQGANALVFDGGAVWEKGSAPEYGNINLGTIIFYDENNEPHVYTNSGKKSVKPFLYLYGTPSSTTTAFSMYRGTKITNFEMSGGANQGTVRVESGSTMCMYGGEISYCAVTNSPEGGTGAGIYCHGGTLKIYGGAVTHNAAATSADATGNDTRGSADGAGIAIDPSTLAPKSETTSGHFYMYGGEVSYNHGSVEYKSQGADGGGIMLRYSYAFMYGGEIRGNYAGGTGGGLCAWDSDFTMYGGTVAANHAVFGGGLGVVCDGTGGIAYVNIYGGSVQDNNAFQNKTPELASYGGYGGGICVGSNSYPAYALITVTTGVTISGNKSYYGGGLAVYTNSNGNQLKMEGGLITGNAAYELPSAYASSYCATYEDPVSAKGGGVYVSNSSTPGQAMLLLSGDASIDSSNAVSFNLLAGATPSTTVAPISVTGQLTGSGLGALVYIDSADVETWSKGPIISNASAYLNKFVLDGSESSFAKSGTNIVIESSSSGVYIAQIGTKKYTTLKAAVEAASSGATIDILQSATVNDGQITIDKILTIRPGTGLDVTLVLASDAEFSSTDHGWFNVIKDGLLTFNGTNGANSRLTIDGNGTGRRLENPNCQSISLVYIDGGSYMQTGDLYLRNNITESAGSAVNVSAEGGSFSMSGGVIENNTSRHDNGGAVFVGAGVFEWTGGAIQNNVSESDLTVADYGVYLSSNTSSLKLDNSVSLISNAIYLGAAKIYVESNFEFDGTIPIVLPDASTLQAGTTVIYGKKDVHGKFVVNSASENDVMTLGSVTLDTGDYRNNIVVHKTLMYLLDSRYAFDEAGNAVHLDDVETSEYITSVIENFVSDASGVHSVKTRGNGKILAILISSTGEVPALNKSDASISDIYSRVGYILTAWTDNKANGVTVNWNNALTYQESTTNITLYPRWLENNYVLSFDKNAPGGQNTNANVFGDDVDSVSFVYGEVSGESSVGMPSNNWYVIGYAFGGWKETADDAGTVFAKSDFIESEDLAMFTASADNRGQYSLTVYANWVPLFKGGIGTELTPFVIETAEQLQRLQQTVNGDEVTVDEYQYYNAFDASKNLKIVSYNYSGMYFTLVADIHVAHTGVIGNSITNAFAGTFNGNFNTVTLNGSALFGNLYTAKISGIILDGSVSSATSNYVGALAEVITSGDISDVANMATVNVSGKTAGGIAGQINGVQLARSFNHGEVNAVIAGGIVGEVVGSENTLRNIYNTGAVTGESVVGGIVGSASSVLIESAFNGGDVTGASLGAIVGNMSNGVTFASSYFNTDREYSVNPVTATASGNVANVTPLPSSQMAINEEGEAPLGMSGFVGNDRWTFQASEDGYFYPQLKVFADNVQTVSQHSVQLTVKQGTTQEPLVPEQTFKVTYILSGGAFRFDGPSGTEDIVLNTTSSNVQYFSFADSSNVHYYADGNNFFIIIKFTTGNNATVSEPDAPSRIGYDFAGWFIDEGLTSQYDFASGVSATDITLYAKWEAIEYRIAYDLNGGAAVGQQQALFVKLGSDEVTLDLGQMSDSDVGFYTQRTGYFFSYWSYTYNEGNVTKTCNVGKVQLLFSESGEPTALLTDTTEHTAVSIKLADLISNELRFSANWKVRTYNISYVFVDENGEEIQGVASGNPTSYTIEQAVSFTNPTKAGYTFKNWHIDSVDGEIVHNIARGSVGNRTIYGVFNANTYRVTFNTGEGDLDIDRLGAAVSLFTTDTSSGYYMANVTYNVAPGTKFNLTDDDEVVAKREGYEFLYWSKVRDVASEELRFDFDSPYNVADNITLYAIYKVSTFSVNVGIDYRKQSDSEEEIEDKDSRYFLVSEVVALRDKAIQRYEDITITIPEEAYIGSDRAKCSNYIIDGVAYGRSAYAYLVAPQGEGSFTGWNNLEKIVETTEDAAVTASFILPVKITFTNTYIETERVKELGVIAGQAVTEANILDNNLQPEVEGYQFDSWVDIDGNKVDVVGVVFQKATLLFARYTPVSVTINFVVTDPFKPENGDAPDGFQLNAPASVEVQYDKLFDDSLPMLVRTGYSFDGWYSEDGRLVTTNSAVRAFVVVDEDGYSVTLYANHWTAETYTITLSPGVGIAANFANGVSSTIQYTYDDTYSTDGVAVPCDGDRTIQRQGYTLTGWYFNGEMLEISDGEAVLPEGTYGNITLTAGWERRSLTVMFSAEEGYFEVPATIPQGAKYYSVSGDEETEVTTEGAQAQLYKVTVQYGSGAVAPLRPFREGYAFSVWDKSYSEITEDITVNAVYAIQSYSLYLSAGGGTFSNGSALVTISGVQFNSEVSFANLQKPQRVGHTFTGWKGMEIELTEGSSINMLARDMTLVAQWEVEKYTISFVISEDVKTAIGGNVVQFFKNTYGITSDFEVTSDGASWTVEYGTDLSILNKTFKPNDNQTLVWTNNNVITMFALATQNVSVTATLINHTSEVVDVTFEYYLDETYVYPYSKNNAIVFPQPAHNGYTFVGWFTQNGGVEPYEWGERVTSATATSNVTYYAQWQAVTYNISYVNGGNLSVTTYKINDTELNLHQPTRTGYKFSGWFTDSSLTEDTRFEFVSGETFGNQTLFAKWDVKNYEVTFNNVTSNDGTVVSSTFSLAYGAEFANLAKIWSRDYHTVTVKFAGSDVEFNLPGGSILPALDELYKEGDESLFELEDGVYTATFTVSYNPVAYKINFYNVGNDVYHNMYYRFDDQPTVFAAALPSDIPVGNTFVSWGVALSGGSLQAVESYKIELQGSEFMIKFVGSSGNVVAMQDMGTDVELYPMLRTTTYNVIFKALTDIESGDISGEMARQVFVYNVPQALSVNGFARVGYTFTSWKDESGITYSNGQVLTLTGEDTEIILTAQWTPNVYQVYFNAAGGTLSTEVVVQASFNTSVTLPAPVRTGYKFIGWKIKETTYNAGASFAINADAISNGNLITLVAQWQAENYTITFNANYEGGTVNPTTLTYTVLTQNQDLTLPTISREYFTFGGWYLDAACNNAFSYTQGTTAGDLTLYAKWMAIEYTITLNANYEGGTVAPETLTFTTTTSSLMLPTPVRAGYTFGGWYLDSSCNEAFEFTPGSTGDKDLYAKWSAIEYSITLNANGGTVTYEPLTYSMETAALTLPVPTRAGYRFAGWTLDGTALDKIEDTDSYGIPDGTTGNITLVAQWTNVSYTVTFNTGVFGGTLAGAMLSFGGTQSVTLPALTKDGYVFNGWTVGDSNSVHTGSISLAQLLNIIPQPDQDTFALTVNYSVATFTITYVLNGGTNHADNPSSYDVETETITLSNPARSGYTFNGWYASADFSGQAVTSVAKGSTGNRTLYAKWSANESTVTFVANGGSLTNNQTKTVKFGQPYGALPTPTRAGYAFVGWFTENGTGDSWGSEVTADTIVNSTSAHSLYAKWTAVQYSVTYMLNGGALGSGVENPSTYTVANLSLELNAPARTGYTFAGWILNGVKLTTSEGKYVLPAGTTGNIVLVATWSTINYDITYVLDGGTNASANPANYTVESIVTFANPSKASYTFAGWFDNAEFNGSAVTGITQNTTGSKTLYAKWVAVQYSISYMLNGGALGSGVENPSTYTVANLSLELNEPTRTGYNFAGWNLNGEKLTISADKYVLPAGTTGNITLVATWTEKTYTVTVSAGENATFKDLPDTYTVVDGNIVLESQLYNADIYATLHGIREYLAHNNGYNFLTWNNSDTNQPLTTFTLTGDLNIVADWSATEVTLTLIKLDGTSELIILTKGATPDNDKLVNSTNNGYSSIYWTQYGSTEEWTLQNVTESTILREVGVAKEIEVTFSHNYGDTPTTSQITQVFGQPYTLPDTNPTREGYTFIGWFTKDGENWGTQVTAETVVEITAAQTLYAKWEAIYYEITYILNGGSWKDFNLTDANVSYNVTTAITLPQQANIARNGYDFGGWYSDAACENAFSYTQGTTIGNLTLYAKWIAKNSTVTFDANGGTLASGVTKIVTFDQPYGDLPVPTRSGHTFVGWFTATSDGKQITAETIVSEEVDHSVYAIWSKVTYSITYILNGGTNNSDNPTSYDVETTTLTLSNPARTGYTFGGWYSDSACTSVFNHTQGSTGDIELYAKWTAIQSNVTLNANGGDFEGSATATVAVTFGESYGNLPIPELAGYTFVGWFTAAEGGKQITAETTVEITSAQTLYAHWSGKTYTVAFSLNGGSGNATTTTYVYGNGVEVAIPTVTRTGYEFNGWFLNNGLTGNAVSVTANKAMLDALIGEDSSNLITLYVKWTAIEYTVKIDDEEFCKLTLDADSTLIELTVTAQDGYTMNGWKLEPNGAIVISASGSVEVQLINLINLNINNGVAGNVIYLYSDVSANMYAVTFNANRGTLQGENTLNVTFGESYGALPVPTRAGYTFDGWFTTESGGTQVTAEMAVALTAPQTLYAHWTVNNYTVTFNNNDGSATTSSSEVTYGETYGNVPTPTRSGYIFAGWFTEPSSGLQVTTNTVVTITADQTLYAHWTIITYNITYVLDGGTNSSTNLPAYTVITETITLADPTRAGYIFNGWYENAEFSGEKVTSVEKGSTGSRTLYAKWTSIKYTIVFKDGNNVHATLNNVSLDDANNGIITLTAPASSSNLTYGGWYVQNNAELTYKGTVSLASILQYAQGENNVITFNVVWSDPVSVISYVLNGGVNNDGNPNSYKMGDTFTLLEPTRADYVFVRWYRLEDSERITVTEIASSFVGDITLYAEWEVKAYALTVSLDNWTYGEAPKAPVVTVKLNQAEVSASAGQFVYEYSADCRTWTTTVPANAGDYFVRAYYLYAGGERSDYAGSDSFSINKKAVTLGKLSATGIYGNELLFTESAIVSYNGLAAGDDASAITLKQVELALADSAARIIVGEAYAIKVTIVKFESDNYTVTVDAQGEFTYVFSKRDVIVTILHTETPYKVQPDLSNVESLVTVAGLASGDSIADLRITLKCNINNGGKVGDYAITGTSTSVNYNVTFAEGACTVVPLDVALEIVGGGVYNGEITPAKVVNITCSDERVTAAILNEIKNELLTGDKFTFIYAGASFDGVLYNQPNEVPTNAGVYYATNTYTDANYRFSGLSKEFRIEKANNSVTDLTINGWMFGGYDAETNAPKNSIAEYGDIVYTYSDSINGVYTASIPQNVGVYYVRAEVAEGANYKAVIGTPVMFRISKAILNAPQAVIVYEGDNRNVEYTGRELRLEISGFDSTLMLVSYDGQTIVDGNNVAVVAVNAGIYTIKISIVDVNNYTWAAGVITDENGNVTLIWNIAKKKVAVPVGSNVVIDVSGEYETYIPDGFDASIMEIVGNREAFGGNYIAIITLKDSDNYEWADAQVGEQIKIEWRMDGISKAFVIAVSVLGALALVGCVFVGAQFILHAHNKRREERELDRNSKADAANGSDEPNDQENQQDAQE